MKKFIVLLMVIISIVAYAACFGTDDPPADNTPPAGDTQPPPGDTQPPDKTTEVVEYEITYSHARLDKNSIGTVWVTAIAEVTNTGNTDLFLGSGSMDLEDESGKLIEVLNMVSVFPQIISPGEKAYYFKSTTLSDVDVNTEVSFVLHSDIEKSKTEKISFPITEVVISDKDYGGIQAVGRVENTSDKDEGFLYVAIVIFDSNDKPMAVLFAIPEVKAGKKIGFSATALSLPDDITAASVSRHVAFGYPYQIFNF